MRLLARLAVGTLAATLAGCGGSVAMKVEADVPAALVMRVPVTVGVHYPPEFAGYVYREDSEERPDWAIDAGSSQKAIFDRVLGSLFERVVPVDGTRASGVDGIIEPAVEAMQFATPEETRLDVYEAWVRYRVRLYAPDGTLLAEHPFAAYGKAEKPGFLASKTDGLREAVGVALRDAGARFAVGFAETQGVKDWLAGIAAARRAGGS